VAGGISFAGVLAFIFADSIVLPIIAIHSKYYGARFTVNVLAGLLFVAMFWLTQRRDQTRQLPTMGVAREGS
jgi:hypothetical protein